MTNTSHKHRAAAIALILALAAALSLSAFAAPEDALTKPTETAAQNQNTLAPPILTPPDATQPLVIAPAPSVTAVPTTKATTQTQAPAASDLAQDASVTADSADQTFMESVRANPPVLTALIMSALALLLAVIALARGGKGRGQRRRRNPYF